MKILSLAASLALALCLPLAASAQTVAPPPNGSPVQAHHDPGKATYGHWMKRLAGVNLSSDQQQHVQSLLGQYAQQHPVGSPRDPQGAHALRDQIFGVLNPQQQEQVRQNMHAMKAQARQRRLERTQQQGQPQPAAPPATR
jgi:hypothetical protein